MPGGDVQLSPPRGRRPPRRASQGAGKDVHLSAWPCSQSMFSACAVRLLPTCHRSAEVQLFAFFMNEALKASHPLRTMEDLDFFAFL